MGESIEVCLDCGDHALDFLLTDVKVGGEPVEMCVFIIGLDADVL